MRAAWIAVTSRSSSDRRSEARKPGPGQAAGVMEQLDLVPRRVLHSQRMVYQLDHVAVRIMNVGVVSVAILAASVRRAALFTDSRCRTIGHAQFVQVGNHFLPVRDLHREMDRWYPNWISNISRMNLRAPYPQLELPCIEVRATVQKFCVQHLLIPLPGPLAVANLDIDVLDQCHPGHSVTSCHRVCTGRA